jgi:hypothetical protein
MSPELIDRLTPPLSITEAINQRYAPIPYHRIRDLAPLDPHDAVDWHLNRAAQSAVAVGICEADLLRSLDFLYLCEAGIPENDHAAVHAFLVASGKARAADCETDK